MTEISQHSVSFAVRTGLQTVLGAGLLVLLVAVLPLPGFDHYSADMDSALLLSEGSSAELPHRRDSAAVPLDSQPLPLAAVGGLSVPDVVPVIPGMVQTVLQGSAGQSATVVRLSMGLLQFLSTVISPDETGKPDWIRDVPEGRIVCSSASLPDENPDAGLPEAILKALLASSDRLSESERSELLADSSRHTQLLEALAPQQLIEQRWSHEEVLDLGDGKQQTVTVTYVLIQASEEDLQPVHKMLDATLQSGRVSQVAGALTILLTLQCLGVVCLRRIF